MSTVEATGLKKDVEKWREVLVITDSVLGWEKVRHSFMIPLLFVISLFSKHEN